MFGISRRRRDPLVVVLAWAALVAGGIAYCYKEPRDRMASASWRKLGAGFDHAFLSPQVDPVKCVADLACRTGRRSLSVAVTGKLLTTIQGGSARFQLAGERYTPEADQQLSSCLSGLVKTVAVPCPGCKDETTSFPWKTTIYQAARPARCLSSGPHASEVVEPGDGAGRN